VAQGSGEECRFLGQERDSGTQGLLVDARDVDAVDHDAPGFWRQDGEEGEGEGGFAGASTAGHGGGGAAGEGAGDGGQSGVEVRSVAQSNVLEYDGGAVGWPGGWGLDFAGVFEVEVEELDDTFCGWRLVGGKDEERVLHTD